MYEMVEFFAYYFHVLRQKAGVCVHTDNTQTHTRVMSNSFLSRLSVGRPSLAGGVWYGQLDSLGEGSLHVCVCVCVSVFGTCVPAWGCLVCRIC